VAYYIEVLKGYKSKTATREQVAGGRLQRRRRRLGSEVWKGLVERRLEEVVDDIEEVLRRRTKDMIWKGIRSRGRDLSQVVRREKVEQQRSRGRQTSITEKDACTLKLISHAGH
jgi:hypothetical protein